MLKCNPTELSDSMDMLVYWLDPFLQVLQNSLYCRASPAQGHKQFGGFKAFLLFLYVIYINLDLHNKPHIFQSHAVQDSATFTHKNTA